MLDKYIQSLGQIAPKKDSEETEELYIDNGRVEKAEKGDESE
jgi:hypothetical protein